jgi:ubiquitin-protein ligase
MSQGVVRLRRLAADFEKVKDYVRRHPRLKLVQTEGEPPERYQIEYQVKGLRQREGEVVYERTHLVEIHLPLQYPRLPPQCRMLTPIFHPNIAPHAICIGDHWSPGEPLVSILSRIGEMISYQSYNTKSPLNGEAAKWVAENEDQLPIDPVSMDLDDAGAGATPPPVPAPRPVAPTPPPAPSATTTAVAPPPAQQAVDVIVQVCPSCSAKLRLPATQAGKKARCPRCQNVFTVSL